MDFTLTPEQELLRDSARSLLTKECPTSLVRAHADDPSAADPLWKHLREWTELGAGPLVDLCLFLEETGAVLAPGPFFATTALYAPLLGAIGAEAGAGVGTVAFPDHPYVLEAGRADVVAVVESHPSGGQVRMIERPPARFVATIDTSRRLYSIDTGGAGDAVPINGVPINSVPINGVPIAADALDGVLARAHVALAAELMGTVRWLFDTTLAYAKTRVQFDRPIGSFQAVQHKLANMALVKEQAWSAVYYAAMTIDAGDPERHRAALVAKVMAGEAAKLNAKDAIQIHGGVGYTWEHDLHLYIRRAYASEYLFGTSDWHRDRLAALVL
jgi:alkylation response protein AidB-like acyl-CoA dehydrogenase